jgi:hypothetical protein
MFSLVGWLVAVCISFPLHGSSPFVDFSIVALTSAFIDFITQVHVTQVAVGTTPAKTA